MRTALIILGGFVLLGVFVLVARLAGGDAADRATVIATQVFIPVWLALAGVNMWVGVGKGYSVAVELPIFLLIFALPAAAAAFIWWKFS
ncbi:MAG: hypothetical protein ACRET6_13580 [Burkholderiales bacterium]